MKVILDEGVPRQLVRALRDRGLDASRFDPRLAGLDNGALIAEVEASGFDVLLTNDKNIADQRSLRGRKLAVVALPLNRRRELVERVDDIADTIVRAKPGQHILMDMDGSRTAKKIEHGSESVATLPPVPPFVR